ncbi:aminoglycoside phosphotransferase family protein [Streptosporangium sp. NBC_01639]|uniref:aminoglycoside phosphotransferase family protein n=1 Tax=Streptosporangium sp. NBC_01639 TaxID=2975948 RepID=UPI003866C9F3|nr:aminoglycoside phosphotransferase family protein [Streptosporangium sp. NBC_01639]
MLDLRVDPVAEARLVNRFGPGVRPWLTALPALAERLAVRWDLEIVEAVSRGGTSRIFRVRRADSGGAFLKLTPEPAICAAEALALNAWADTPQVVDLVAADVAAGALLLDAVEPGTTADRPGGRPAPQEISGLLKSLRVTEVPDGLPPLRERVAFLFELTRRRLRPGALEDDVLDRSLAAALALAEDGPIGLVHGDLHPGNVLDGGPRGPVVIDPRPSVGDPTFDAVDWVLPADDLDRLRENIAQLDVDHGRLMLWCRAIAILLAVPRLSHGPHDAETAFLLRLATA